MLLENSTVRLTYLQRHNMSETQFFEVHRPIPIAISKFLPPIWWFIGIIGNVIALLVWMQPKMRHSSGYYLAALAITDLLFLPLSIVFEVNFTYREPLLDRPVLCQWFAIFYLSVQYMSPILVLAFTVERYLSVCHPFRMVRFNQSSGHVTLYVICALCAFAFGVNAVQGYFWTTSEQGVCDLRSDVHNNAFYPIWTWFVEMLVFAAVPIAILILNVLVIIEVRNIARLERRNTRTNSIDRRSTTVMLLGVSFYQIVTVLPVTVIYSLYASGDYQHRDLYMTDEQVAVDETWQRYLNYMTTRIIIQHIGMSHYAVNFFIYLLTGKIFRKQLQELCAALCCHSRLKHLVGVTILSRTAQTSLSSNRISAAQTRTPKEKASPQGGQSQIEGATHINNCIFEMDETNKELRSGQIITSASQTALTLLFKYAEENDSA